MRLRVELHTKRVELGSAWSETERGLRLCNELGSMQCGTHGCTPTYLH